MPTLKLEVSAEPVELAQAMNAHVAFIALLKRKASRTSLRTMLWALLFIGLAGVVFVPDFIPVKPIALPVGIVIGLSTVYAIVLMALALDTYLDSRRLAAPVALGHIEEGAPDSAGGAPRGKAMNPYVGWFVFAGVAAVFVVMLRHGGPPNPVPGPPTPAAAAVTPYGGGRTVEALEVPAAQIFLGSLVATWWGVSLFGKAQRRQQARHQLETQPAVLLPRTWEIDEAGLVERGPTWESHMAWAHVKRFVETPHVILLYPSDASFYLLPKRAFGGESRLLQFLGLLTRNVPDGVMQPRPVRGFPVLPVPALVVRPTGTAQADDASEV